MHHAGGAHLVPAALQAVLLGRFGVAAAARWRLAPRAAVLPPRTPERHRARGGDARPSVGRRNRALQEDDSVPTCSLRRYFGSFLVPVLSAAGARGASEEREGDGLVRKRGRKDRDGLGGGGGEEAPLYSLSGPFSWQLFPVIHLRPGAYLPQSLITSLSLASAEPCTPRRASPLGQPPCSDAPPGALAAQAGRGRIGGRAAPARVRPSPKMTPIAPRLETCPGRGRAPDQLHRRTASQRPRGGWDRAQTAAAIAARHALLQRRFDGGRVTPGVSHK